MELTREIQLILELSKLTDLDIEKIKTLSSEVFNWYLFFKYALSNRVVGLIHYNIMRFRLTIYFPRYLRSIFLFCYNGQKKQNKIYLSHLEVFKEACAEHGITCVPVKGSMLIPALYHDYGARFMGDIDILVRYEDINIINDIMKELGFQQARFDYLDRKVVPISRGEQIKWKIGMSNLHPYIKPIDSEYVPFVKYDFRYALDDSLNKDPINEIIDVTAKTKHVQKEHVLTHLCCHMFDESKHSMKSYIGKDVNLIKYIDIREYVAKYIDRYDFEKTLAFCKKYGFEKQLYFTFYHLNRIFNDGYEDDVLKEVPMDDLSFLTAYGNKSNIDEHEWETDFIDRMFEGYNADQTKSKPLFFEID